MAKYLVIVESPAKVKTIKKFLGANYEVMASQGHVRDLPKSQLGFDPEHDYEPKYITIRGKGDLLASLRKEVKKADKVYLATDPDREGEAISWHLYYALKLESKKVYRITFNEITKNAVKESLKNAREIDMNLVDAQQARRMLDRMVGYRISPLLWAKIKRGLSAGRVQSVALRIICDREDEINAFIPEEYWSLDVNLKVKGEKKPICAKYYGTTEKKQGITSKEQADRANRIAATTAVKPVLPPSATPDALSTKVVVVEVPRTAPTAVPTESESSAPRIRGRRPCSSSMLALDATPMRVPRVSNISTNRNANMTTRKSREATRLKSIFMKVGARLGMEIPLEKSGSRL